MADLLFEIGSEEIPAGFIVPALNYMKDFTAKAFAEVKLANSGMETFGTPRRLAIRIKDVPEKLDDIDEVKMGPPKSAAFNKDGNPTKAGLGFAKNLGVDISAVGFEQTEKGVYLCLKRTIPGRPAKEFLEGLLTELMVKIPFPKTMKWSNPGVTFARPVHWILAIYGTQILDIRFGNLTSGDTTCGNRFMSPAPVKISSPSDYEKTLEKAFVIPGIEKRKSLIWEGLEKAANADGGHVLDKELLDEVVNLVEWPHVIKGSFKPEFLSLPKEVPVTEMKHHQRYFPIYTDKEGKKLKPAFFTICNIVPRNDSVVQAGNERVLKARLDDGAYFFDQDLKTPLADYAARLKDVIYHKDLGTCLDKVERFTMNALWLAEKLSPEKRDKIKLACGLCKGDLNSLMVGEFPELQGIMGREYALKQGADPEVADVIRDHYLPASADDVLPRGPAGDIVGMADRIDTICGCFGIGMPPTGTSDPYAIRRQTIAIENIILGKGYVLKISELISQSIKTLSSKLKKPAADVQADVMEYFRQRFAGILQSKGITGDVIESVIGSFDDALDTFARAEALASIKSEPWLASICSASKRVENILKKADATDSIDDGLFAQEQEISLYKAFRDVETPFINHAAGGEYNEALKLLAGLKEPIDAFFDKVLVMAEDQHVRANRLALLKRIVSMFSRVARFSAITT
jgi:glycyl-tRNA synthetase beta chain